MSDRLGQLYEQMQVKEYKDLEEEHPTLIEALRKRIEMLEEKVSMMLAGK